jgi:hypothetical protein
MRFTLEASLLQVLVSSSLSDRGFSGNGTWNHDTRTPRKVRWITKKIYKTMGRPDGINYCRIIEDWDALKQAT